MYCHHCGKGSFKNVQRRRLREGAAFQKELGSKTKEPQEKDLQITNLRKSLSDAVEKIQELEKDVRAEDERRMARHPIQNLEEDMSDDETFNRVADHVDSSLNDQTTGISVRSTSSQN